MVPSSLYEAMFLRQLRKWDISGLLVVPHSQLQQDWEQNTLGVAPNHKLFQKPGLWWHEGVSSTERIGEVVSDLSTETLMNSLDRILPESQERFSSRELPRATLMFKEVRSEVWPTFANN